MLLQDGLSGVNEWRAPGAVLLISCYELGHQPLGLASPLAFLERAGFAPSALDIANESLDEGKVKAALFIGISVPMHTALRLGVPLAQRIRTLNPRAHICFYGLYALLNAKYLLATVADTVLGGESEQVLVELVQTLAGGRKPETSIVPVLERLSFPRPSRGSLPDLQRYSHLVHGDRTIPAGHVEASRGCLHTCRHCPIPPVYGGRFFVVPREVVLEDIGRQVAAGARHISFGDPDFLNGPGHSLAIGRDLHERFPDVTFDCTTKVEHILKHRAIFPELAALGCLFVVSAVESLSDTVLGHLDKGHTRADLVEALRIVRNAGIALRPTFVSFTPWTTLADYRALQAFIAAEGLVRHVDAIQLTIRLLVPPGSLLLESPALQPHLGQLDQPAFSYRWRHPDPRMDALQRAAATAVEQATHAGDSPEQIFQRLWELARAAAGDELPLPVLSGQAMPSPHLSEPWFC